MPPASDCRAGPRGVWFAAMPFEVDEQKAAQATKAFRQPSEYERSDLPWLEDAKMVLWVLGVVALGLISLGLLAYWLLGLLAG